MFLKKEVLSSKKLAEGREDEKDVEIEINIVSQMSKGSDRGSIIFDGGGTAHCACSVPYPTPVFI